MRIGVIGAGRIGSNAARLFVRAGHDVMISFSRDEAKLARRGTELGVRTGTPAQAAAFGDVVMLAVRWPDVDTALRQAGDLSGKIVIDTTNQFDRSLAPPDNTDLSRILVPLGSDSAARHNARKAPGARWVKAFNTLTAGFQAEVAGRTGADRVVIFYATDDEAAVPTVEQLIEDAGFDPVRSGTLDRTEVGHQEPRGVLYGEEFHLEEARALVARVRGTEPTGSGRVHG